MWPSRGNPTVMLYRCDGRVCDDRWLLGFAAPDDVVRAQLRRTESAAQSFIRGRALASYALADLARGCEPSPVIERRCAVCGQEGHGRPRLRGAGRMSISTSRAGEHAVVALAETSHLGVDVVLLDAAREISRLGRVAFSSRELRELEGLPLPARDYAAIRAWATKEAFSKALGIGVGLDFPLIDVVIDPERQPGVLKCAIDCSPPMAWTFAESAFNAGVIVWATPDSFDRTLIVDVSTDPDADG